MVDKFTTFVLYQGNDLAKEFPIPFIFFENSNVLAKTQIEGSSTEIVLIENVDYTITQFANKKGALILSSALASNTKLLLQLEVPAKQGMALTSASQIPTNILEDNLDRIAVAVMILQDEIKKAILLSNFNENISPTELLEQIFLANTSALQAASAANASAQEAKEYVESGILSLTEDKKNALEEIALEVQKAENKAQEASNEADRAKQEADKAYNLHIGTEYITRLKTIPFGHIYIDDGAIYSRELFPNFYDTQLLTGNLPTKPISEWVLDEYGYCDYYGIDTVNNTFRVPKKRPFVAGGASQESLGQTKGSALTGEHTLTIDEMPSHNHVANSAAWGGSANGGSGTPLLPQSGSSATSSTGGSKAHTHPNNAPIHDTGRWVVVAYNTQEEISIAQVQGLLQMYDTKANVSDVQYRCIYGKGQAPSNDPNAIEDEALGLNGVVSNSSAYEFFCPFGYFPVIVQAEVFLEELGGWLRADITDNILNTGIISWKTNNTLYIQAGSLGVFNVNNTQITSAPCRVKVWYIGTNMATPTTNFETFFTFDGNNFILQDNSQLKVQG